MRRTSITLLVAALLAVGGLVGRAEAADTPATFSITSAGTLSISAPVASVNLGSVAAGTTTFSPSLGTVTVTDSRASVIAAWTATATGTHFDNQSVGATPATDVNHRVSNLGITYTAVPSVSSGVGVATPTAGTLAVGGLVVFAGSGSNVVTWNPTLTFTLLPTQSAGTYAGTITHSVS